MGLSLADVLILRRTMALSGRLAPILDADTLAELEPMIMVSTGRALGCYALLGQALLCDPALPTTKEELARLRWECDGGSTLVPVRIARAACGLAEAIYGAVS
jgi:hypothetical protein